MESSIITLDHRERFSKMKKMSEISWRDQESNAIRYIKNEIFVDVEENDTGGIVRLTNHTTASCLKISIKIRDELLRFDCVHPAVVLIEYKLKKTKLNGESVYGYVYWIHCAYP